MKTAVIVATKVGFQGIEGQTAWRVLGTLLSKGINKAMGLYDAAAENILKIRDLCEFGDYDVFVLMNGKVFVTEESIRILSRIAVEQDEFVPDINGIQVGGGGYTGTI